MEAAKTGQSVQTIASDSRSLAAEMDRGRVETSSVGMVVGSGVSVEIAAGVDSAAVGGLP